MKQSSIFLLILIFSRGIVVNCQQYPLCLEKLIIKTAEQHKKNSCDGSDKLIRIEQYSYKDTLLYKLVFEIKTYCPDYINNTVFYDANCQLKIQIRDGGLKYRHQVIPSYVNEKEIKFIKSIDWKKADKQEAKVDYATRLTIDENGDQLKKFYLGLNVEHLWIEGNHINWKTGEANSPDATIGIHTHCSAFVAAACERMGIYILRPPQNGQILLAKGQYDWLQTEDARKNGWSSLTDINRLSLYVQAQKLANSGKVVVTIVKNPDGSKPGHTVLVIPKETDIKTLEKSGPMIIMAGTHNFNFISLKNGFKTHITGWPENEILFFMNNGK